MKRGVYFLSNDTILDITIAFLNSFRKHNPESNLCLIPFNDQYGKIAALSEKYNFQIYDDADTLKLCDELSNKVTGKTVGHFRKFAIWSGPYNEFIYIDCDMLVLRNVELAYEDLDAYDFITTHSNQPNLPDYVWKLGATSAGLSNDQIDYSANTGFIVSKRGLFDVRNLIDTSEYQNYIPYLYDWTYEQPFLNLVIVTSKYKYTSMYQLRQTGENPNTMSECWGQVANGIFNNGEFAVPGYDRLVVIHWSGPTKPSPITNLPYQDLWNYYYALI